jgi:uncharacterized membrane protein YhfC
MIPFLLFLNFALMIVLPVLVGIFIHRRWGPSWRLYFIGLATFIGSQLLHIPFNWLIINRLQLIPTDTAVTSSLIILAVFLGLSAGVFEEGARYLTYRFWAKDARTWAKGMMLGAGHGGIEAILLGSLGLINFVVLLGLSQGYFTSLIPAEQMGLVDAQIAEMFGLPWHMAVLGAVERAFAICLHLALSVMVLQVFLRRNILWLLAAILWHAAVNATAVYAASTTDPITTEILIGIYALLSLGIIYWLYEPNPAEPEIEPLPAVEPVQPVAIEPTAESLDKSKYT